LAIRVFLALSALAWLPYGVFCWVRPGYLAEAVGVVAASTTATIELRAMYGGLQVAVGLLAAAGVVFEGLRRPSLLLLAFLCAGVGTARFSGVLMDGEFSLYTRYALGFEFVSTALAMHFLSRMRAVA